MKLYKSAKNCYFAAPNGDVAEYYYGLEISVMITTEMLLFQFGGNRKVLRKFLRHCFCVCEKKLFMCHKRC